MPAGKMQYRITVTDPHGQEVECGVVEHAEAAQEVEYWRAEYPHYTVTLDAREVTPWARMDERNVEGLLRVARLDREAADAE